MNTPLFDYVHLDGLPSEGRDYDFGSHVIVRGLKFSEVYAFSRYLDGDVSTADLLRSYRDVIHFVGPNGQDLGIESLELADFNYAMSASSLLTLDSVHLKLTRVICKSCSESFSANVGLEDVEFKLLFPEISPKSGSIEVHPLRVRDKILLENSEELLNLYVSKYDYVEPETFDELLSYAVSLPYSDEDSLLNNVFRLEHDIELSKAISELNDKMAIVLKPLRVTCTKCGTVNERKFSLSQVRNHLVLPQETVHKVVTTFVNKNKFYPGDIPMDMVKSLIKADKR